MGKAKPDSNHPYHSEEEKGCAVEDLNAKFPFLEFPFSLSNLPPLPAIILRLNYLLDQNRPSIQGIIKTILADPSLTMQVLCILTQTSNYHPQNALTISRIIHYKGLRPIKEQLNAFSIFNQNSALQKQSGFDLYAFWKNSVFTALAAETLANELKLENLEEAYLAGLLHDIGKLILARFAPAANKKFAKLQKKYEESLLLEERIFQTTHLKVGDQIGSFLRLPYSIVEVIKNHHLEIYSGNKAIFHQTLNQIIFTAKSIAKLFCFRDQSSYYYYEGRDRAANYLDVSHSAYKRIVRKVSNKIYDTMDEIHLSIEVFQNYGKKLEDASQFAGELRAKLRKSEEKLKNLEMKNAILSEILPLLFQEKSKETLIKNLIGAIDVYGGVKCVVLFLYNPAKKFLQSKLHFGLPVNDNLRWAKIDANDKGVIAASLSQKKTFCINHYYESQNEEDLFSYEELKYVKKFPFAVIPLYTPREPIGVVYISHGETERLIEPDRLKALEKICEYVCLALSKRKGLRS